MSTAFDYVNAINWSKENLVKTSHDEVNYKRESFIVNRALSYYTDTILYANEINCFKDIDPKMAHDYYMQSIPKKKRFAKWGKKKKPSTSVAILMEYYQINSTKAHKASQILSDDEINEITRKLHKGGVK